MIIRRELLIYDSVDLFYDTTSLIRPKEAPADAGAFN